MQRVLITPKTYPVNLLDKDWDKRKCYYTSYGSSSQQDFIDKIHDLKLRDDDVWVLSNPKSGTTWMQELLWLLLNDCDFEAALAEHLELRSPHMEFDYEVHRKLERALKPVEELKSPRLIQSHLPLPLLPAELWQKKAKVVYVFRNPKDACVSRYYHMASLGFSADKTVSQYVADYLEKNVYLDAQIEHACEFYRLRNEPWVYYTSYERMRSNLRGVLEDLCKFLNKTVTEQQMQELLKHLSFEEMKKNPTTNHLWEKSHVKSLADVDKKALGFVRRGQVNGYKDELTPEVIEKANKAIEKQLRENGVTLNELLLLNE